MPTGRLFSTCHYWSYCCGALLYRIILAHHGLQLAGGARSLSVFDSDRGCGSISPLVVTGGKSGDVALHDFRFLSTGMSQHNRISTARQDIKSGTSGGTANGMVWHIPKAHLGNCDSAWHCSNFSWFLCLISDCPSAGSVTKVTAIPNTSLFLTGSKDGDVKLWDAKNSQLVFHWPKLHERHTFFQPSSRGFGGVVRVCNIIDGIYNLSPH